MKTRTVVASDGGEWTAVSEGRGLWTFYAPGPDEWWKGGRDVYSCRRWSFAVDLKS